MMATKRQTTSTQTIPTTAPTMAEDDVSCGGAMGKQWDFGFDSKGCIAVCHEQTLEKREEGRD